MGTLNGESRRVGGATLGTLEKQFQIGWGEGNNVAGEPKAKVIPLSAAGPAETKARILDAAETLFMEHGYEATSLRAITAAGLSVPRDVAVVGFDDIAMAAHFNPALTTMRQPCRDIAVTAFRAMMERIADPALPARGLYLTPQLVVRDSCGAYLPRDS